MARVSTYLNFTRSTEEAFSFYKSVFRTEYASPLNRFSDIPQQPGGPVIPDEDMNLVMHVELPTIGNHVIMGTDAPESMGFSVTPGNNMYINLEPDDRTETQRLFRELSS